MCPARRILQILSDPKQQDSCYDRELSGNYKKGMTQVASLVERLHLVRCQVAFFGGKQGIGHRVLSPVSLKKPSATGAPEYDSNTRRRDCASRAEVNHSL